ncbi:MAG: hypothetical protein ABMA64_23115 [Myxococcota bacterium]
MSAGIVASCGDQWTPGDPPHATAFPLECVHADSTCESCHPADRPIRALDPACVACHVDERPATHDPVTTSTCDDCHQGSCGWDSAASPHPDGFSDPLAHGLEAKLQGPAEGDCRTCHGDDLTGGTTAEGGQARGCDECHASVGHADWRTECTYCHGGVADPTGAPPLDIDGAAQDVSFAAHPAHVGADPDYRVVDCSECHVEPTDALEQLHWWDTTPAAAEVTFLGGLGANTVWNGESCGTNYCHGSGARDDGEVSDDGAPMTCDSCHPTTAGWEAMSGLHAAHLQNDATITCTDCHGAVIGRDGAIATPARHVDGERDLSFSEPTIVSAGGTCAGECHGVDHDAFGWGHLPGYDAPELHGVDSNLRVLECGECHGADWTGGVAQGCDDCHDQEGHGDWRTDCTFCHGGDGGDATGAPPQDIDDTVDPASSSFQAHRAHVGAGEIGHPVYGCTQCHLTPSDALSPGHALDATAGVAEVDLSAGTSPEGGFDPVSRSCGGLYCHGNGQAPSGTVSDGAVPLDCDSCHATTTGHDAMSGTHAEHLAVAGVTCADCHAPVVDAGGDVVTPDRHVDRVVDLDLAATGFSPVEGACTTTCHEVEHDQLGWAGNHPPGFDAPENHGQEALLRLQSCTGTACHGNDLEGGPGPSCDDCHDAGWRADCTWCHGGEGGDTLGVPPSDIDNQLDEARISFKAHPEHVSNRIAPAYGCETCHAPSGAYVDAATDVGHWLVDATETTAEVQFGGIAAGSTYAAGSCSANYCHGNGQAAGSSLDGTVGETCDGCHAFAANRATLSGTHSLHLGVAGVTCADCHGGVVNAAGSVTDPDSHVDGAIAVDASAGFDPVTESCTNSCHSHEHAGQTWTGHHPAGYDQPEFHGQEALFRQQSCATAGCHGVALDGGASGQGCESCHSPDWRQDCVFCHGGAAGDVDGLPPSDLDNVTDEDQITFLAHPEHHDGDDHLAYDCAQCHGSASGTYTDAFTDPGHWWTADPTVGRAEVDFADGLSSAGTYAVGNGSCSGLYCHGDGIGTSGSVPDGASGLGCDDCHATAAPEQLSGTHGAHLAVSGVTCADCHAPVVNATDGIATPALHVNGGLDVDLASTGWDAAAETCVTSCHGVDHDGTTWSGYHTPGYDDPLVHGQDALFRLDTCADAGCHGADLRGATGDSCDDCHTAGWRSDCTYCHGGSGGDTRGAPPEDVDNVTSEAAISFDGHPEHTDADEHPLYACDTCHQGALAYADAVTDPGHWLVSDATTTKAEVKFAGIALGGTYTAGSCANDYCHGDGQVNGTITDSDTALTCDGCHSYATDRGAMSGTHELHLGESGVTCADCHTDVNSSGAITTPTKHVNKVVDLDQVKTGWTSTTSSCTITCHTHPHAATPWTGGHPPGFDAPEVHGPVALTKGQDCATSGCHGTDLGGGSSGVGCDDCHTAGWRSDCTYCHGGQSGDLDGLPPEDLDNVTNEDQISFMAHPEHHDNDDHKSYDCDQCHGAVSLTYTDAFTDPGHWWTSELSPGVADIDLTDGLSPAGTYTATTGTCASMYCHGDGNKTLKSQTDSANGLACNSCHPSNVAGSMSGDHDEHEDEPCSDCHVTVVSSAEAIIDADLHVDGIKQAVPAAATNITFTKSGSTITCSGGKCHGQDHSHNSDKW